MDDDGNDNRMTTMFECFMPFFYNNYNRVVNSCNNFAGYILLLPFESKDTKSQRGGVVIQNLQSWKLTGLGFYSRSI